MRKLLILLCVSCVLTACKDKPAAKTPVDKIFINATVYTVDAEFSKAQSFAIRGDKFVAVGLTDSIQAKYQATETIDLQGKIVYPGFIDAHCHFFGFGASLQSVDLAGTTSFDEVVQRIQEFNNQKPSDFIYGRGWDQNDWETKEFPDKKKLDSLYPDIPVVLERIDGHAYLVNQKALDLAKIDNTTVTEGGEIVKDNKNLTGVLIDNPMELVTAVMPKMTGQQGVAALQDAQEYCFNYGLTTVNDAGLDRETIF